MADNDRKEKLLAMYNDSGLYPNEVHELAKILTTENTALRSRLEEVEKERDAALSYLISCPWCGEQMEKRPISYQIPHLIRHGDERQSRVTALEEALRERDEALARPIYQCTNCGVIRFNKFEACVCGAAAQQLPRDLFKQLIEHLRSVQQELDADFTGR